MYFSPVAIKFKITLLVIACTFGIYISTTPYTPRSLAHQLESIRHIHFTDEAETRSQLKSYGTSQCLPNITQELIVKSRNWNTSCRRSAPFSKRPMSQARIGRVMLHYGELQEGYRRALENHVLHSLIHDTSLDILCDAMSEEWSLWNKPAFILKILLQQMTLPEGERLEWLMWMDTDTLILDQCRPMGSFLPVEDVDRTVLEAEKASRMENRHWYPEDAKTDPKLETDRINLIATKDPYVLNNGIFLLRVSPWAIELFENILAYRFYNPDVHLGHDDQTAMQKVLDTPPFASNVVYMPWHWFNAYPKTGPGYGPQGFRDRPNNGANNIGDFEARRGDFLVHFAGTKKKGEPMREWEDVLDKMGNVWADDRLQRDVSRDVEKFWAERGFR